LHAAADCGLADIQFAGGGREAFMPGRRLEGGQRRKRRQETAGQGQDGLLG